MSTAQELLHADWKEAGCRRKKYWKASSLPVSERFKHAPVPPKSPRDRVLIKVLRMGILSLGRKLTKR